MSNWLGWIGVIGTFLFGGLNMWQFIKNLRRNALWEANRTHLAATQKHLSQILAMCCEAVERGQIIKTPAEQQWVAQLGHNIRAVQHHVGATLETMERRRPPAAVVPAPMAKEAEDSP